MILLDEAAQHSHSATTQVLGARPIPSLDQGPLQRSIASYPAVQTSHGYGRTSRGKQLTSTLATRDE
jgi:hypothetical protein